MQQTFVSYRPNPTLGADRGILCRRFSNGKTKDYDLFLVSSPPFHSDTKSLVPIHPLPPSISVSPAIRVFHHSTKYSGMANTGTDDHHEDSSSLLSKQVEEDGSKGSCNDKGNQPKKGKVDAAPDLPDLSVGDGNGWTAERLPLGHGNVVGEPRARGQWDSSLFGCLYEFCSESEVCFLGTRAPCVLYGINAEGLISGPQTFRNHCWSHCGLCLIGFTCFFLCLSKGKILWPCLCFAPCFSFPNRSALRRRFNLEGGCEAFNRSGGCCGSCLEDEVQREQCESACDLATHVFCHQCALCQEGHEINRRILHPGFNSQPLMAMIPPEEQTMACRA